MNWSSASLWQRISRRTFSFGASPSSQLVFSSMTADELRKLKYQWLELTHQCWQCSADSTSMFWAATKTCLRDRHCWIAETAMMRIRMHLLDKDEWKWENDELETWTPSMMMTSLSFAPFSEYSVRIFFMTSAIWFGDSAAFSCRCQYSLSEEAWIAEFVKPYHFSGEYWIANNQTNCCWFEEPISRQIRRMSTVKSRQNCKVNGKT